MRRTAAALVVGSLLALAAAHDSRAVDSGHRTNLAANQTKEARWGKRPIILQKQQLAAGEEEVGEDLEYEDEQEVEGEAEEEEEVQVQHTTQRSQGEKTKKRRKGSYGYGGGGYKEGHKGGHKGGYKKSLKKYMLPLLIAYKLKFLTLIPLLIGGLILIVASTGFAGFFFALFAVGVGLKKD